MAIAHKTIVAGLLLGGALAVYNLPGCAPFAQNKAREAYNGVQQMLGNPVNQEDAPYRQPEVSEIDSNGRVIRGPSSSESIPGGEAAKGLALLVAAGAGLVLCKRLANGQLTQASNPQPGGHP